MVLDNDTRGWIMTGISGVACVLGAAIIYVDVPVRVFPGMHNFSIAESDAFLSASLSLSFGVMLFSSLYSMLPQSKSYLTSGGYSPRAASYMLIGLFIGGVVGIQILSRVLHHFIPSHVVDCDHTHDEETGDNGPEEMAEHHHEHRHEHRQTNGRPINKPVAESADEDDEDTPLLSRTASISPPKARQSIASDAAKSLPVTENGFTTAPTSRRPSLMPRNLTRTLTRYVAGKKGNCDETGPCMGFSDPCGQDCFRVVQRRGSSLPGHVNSSSRIATWKQLSGDHRPAPLTEDEESAQPNDPMNQRSVSYDRSRTMSDVDGGKLVPRSRSATHHYHHPENEHFEPSKQPRRDSVDSQSVGPEHHHHVPTNAFMNIGLQTSLAIALHKAPEGFITYATNHANPTLGFAVFMALFIHNITEGFAMSLPLYLALGSRWKAIIWSSFLGGVSQPLGAGVAALWFKVANGTGRGAPSEGVYGGMFAVTAGVMTSVALSLFSESLQLSHNKGTCIAFAFLGMAILGLSFALTAK